jgi:hypothetical protein
MLYEPLKWWDYKTFPMQTLKNILRRLNKDRTERDLNRFIEQAENQLARRHSSGKPAEVCVVLFPDKKTTEDCRMMVNIRIDPA